MNSLPLRDVRHRPLLTRRPVQRALTVGAGILVGFEAVAPSAEQFRSLSVAVVVMAAGAWAITRSPRVALVGFLVCTFIGLNLFGTTVAGVTLRPADLFYVPLVVWALRRRRAQPSANIGQGPILLLIFVLGLSLLPLLAVSVDGFASAVVPWARLVQTLSMIWILPHVLTDERDRRFAVGTIMVAAAIELTRALFDAAAVGLVADRLQGGVGPNAEGLLAATLLVLALYAPMPRRRMSRLLLIGIALLGLVTAKSVGSIASVGLTVGVVGFGRTGDERLGRAVRPLRLVLIGIGIIAVVGVLRQDNLPGSQGFEAGTAQQRVIYASAGIEVFREHPLLGVGWQRSADPSIIGTEQLSDHLRQQFSNIRADFFPDVNGASSVHNTYVQVLAEAGLAGGLALIFTMLACWKRIRALGPRLTGGEPQLARTLMIVLCLTLVWLNDNALFGAQPESVLLATTLGVLASFTPMLDNRERHPEKALAAR